MQSSKTTAKPVLTIASTLLAAAQMVACSSTPKVLTVQSYPAEAEVCLKGRIGSHEFAQKVSCVGQTPFEADHVDVLGDDGKKHRVDFGDLDVKESVYLVIKKDGYATQSRQIPAWTHYVNLSRDEPVAPVMQSVAATPVAPVPAAPTTTIAINTNTNPFNTPITMTTTPSAAFAQTPQPTSTSAPTIKPHASSRVPASVTPTQTQEAPTAVAETEATTEN
jgi:hypothetical protein